MNVFLSEVGDSENTIIETIYVTGDELDGTIELVNSENGESMSGSFQFSDVLIFEQKLGGYNTKSWDIRGILPNSCIDSPAKTCLENEILN